MENSTKDLWVIKVAGREDLMFTLHESEASAIKQCAELNRKFSGRFYVDTYHQMEERYEGSSK